VWSAWKFFGFQADKDRKDKLRCHVRDGLDFVKSIAERCQKDSEENNSPACVCGCAFPVREQQDVLVLDVNSTDLVAGLSFPPAAFLEPAFIQCMASAIKDDGWLILNLGCRDRMLRAELLKRLKHQFHEVYAVKPDEDHVNYVVAASNRLKHDPAAKPLDWMNVEARLKQLQQPSVSGFHWDSDMCEDIIDMLRRLQAVHVRDASADTQRHPSGSNPRPAVKLHPVFPKEIRSLSGE